MKWINVNDRMPSKEDFMVLYWSQTIADKYPFIKAAPGLCIWRHKEQKFDWYENPRHFEIDFNELIPITHWMQLPEPPKNETK